MLWIKPQHVKSILSPFLIVVLLCTSCRKDEEEKRAFETSFESIADFDGFYITPQGYLNTCFHELSDSIVFNGNFSHKAWITGPNAPSTAIQNNNHRAYPTIQLYKTDGGSFTTPCYITFKVWLDMALQADTAGGENDWFSLATFSCDESDNWSRTVLVNLNQEGYIHLMHVPLQGQQEHVFQTSSIPFPQREWVEIKIYLDLGENGYAKVWQNGLLVSWANVEGVDNKLAQAHFGLYCSPEIAAGVVYNDDLTIEEVDGE